MKPWNIHVKNLIILSVSGIFKGFKNWQKVAEICYQLVHNRASRGLALFLIWHHRLIYMTLTLCEHACKTVFDVKSGIDPCPSPARSWNKAYQISGCTVAQKKFRFCEKKVKLLLVQLQVCICAKIVFGVRCTLSTRKKEQKNYSASSFYTGSSPTIMLICKTDHPGLSSTFIHIKHHLNARVHFSRITCFTSLCKHHLNVMGMLWVST